MDCFQLLLNCGLDIQDDSLSCITAVDHIFILLAQLNCIRLERAYKIFEFINSLQYSLGAHRCGDRGFPYVYVSICFVYGVGHATPPYHLLKPDYKSPFSTRLFEILTMICDYRMNIPVKALCYYLWPGGIIQNEDIKQLEQSHQPFMNLIAFMISSAYHLRERRDFLEWRELIRETLCVNEDIHHFHRDSSPSPPQMGSILCEGTPLICYLANRTKTRSSHSVNYWKPKSIHRVLLEWLSLLKECQVDLMKYGEKERKILVDNYNYIAPYTEAWNQVDRWYIKDIRYGANLEDWSLVLDVDVEDMEVEEYAGEFWRGLDFSCQEHG